MKLEVDWQKILIECKNKVQTAIKPYQKTTKEPQPDLGVGAGGDVMKPMDLAAETAIVNTLNRHKVSFTLISEESGIKKFGETPNEWFVTVDPIDGSTNFMHGLPFYCCSIAVSAKPTLGNVCAGMVADLVHGITYTAIEGKGSFRNDQKIKPSTTTILRDAVIGLDLNTYKVKEIIPKLTELIAETKHIRHFGANALELCFVADGSTDAFVDIRGKLRTTDVAAAFLIIKEAGGIIITTPNNQEVNAELDPQKTLSFVTSGNLEIHNKILNLVKSAC
jgi:myo-inositol-1(or 4)-monophosphatase